MLDRFVPVARFARTSRPFAAFQRWRLRRWLSGPRSGLAPSIYKQREVLRYAEAFGLSILVETGTFYGAMVLGIFRRFKQVYTIELQPQLHRRAVRMFRGDPGVIPICGDSAVELEKVIRELDQAALFWLDAHYCGEGTAYANVNTPVRRELECILADPQPGHVVLIDDAHDFGRLADYPAIPEIEALVASLRPGHQFRVAGDIIRIHEPRDDLPGFAPDTGG